MMFHDAVNGWIAIQHRRRFKTLLAIFVLGLCFIAGAWLDGMNNRDFARYQQQHQQQEARR